MACIREETDMVKALLKFDGIDVNVQVHDQDGGTALHAACGIRNVEIVKLLIAGINQNIIDKQGHKARVYGSPEIDRLFMKPNLSPAPTQENKNNTHDIVVFALQLSFVLILSPNSNSVVGAPIK